MNYRLNFNLGKKNKIHQICKVWLRNVVKCRKYSPTKFANFVLILFRAGKCTTFGPNVVHFHARNTN
jgi:hypothetical protein